MVFRVAAGTKTKDRALIECPFRNPGQHLRHQSLAAQGARQHIAEFDAAPAGEPQIERASNQAAFMIDKNICGGNERWRRDAMCDVGIGFGAGPMRSPCQKPGDFMVRGVAVEDRPSFPGAIGRSRRRTV